MSTMAMEADQAGTVEFRHTLPNATELFLVGSFNGWNPYAHPMHRDGDGQWVCQLQLPAGTYQFHYLARLHPDEFSARAGASAQWVCSRLEFVVVSPRGGSFEMGSARSVADAEAADSLATPDAGDRMEALFPLSRLETALVRGFRRLPDHESRSAFLDVLEESVYS